MEKRRKKSLRQARKIGTEEKRSKFVLLFAGYVATKEHIQNPFISCYKGDIRPRLLLLDYGREKFKVIHDIRIYQNSQQQRYI